MLRAIIVAVALALAPASVLACSPGGLEVELKFVGRQASLTATEVLKAANWYADTRRYYPSGGTYAIFLYAKPSLGLPHGLAKERAAWLRNLLGSWGVSPEKIEIGVMDFEGALPERANLAGLILDPACPHVCCPGLTPQKED